MPLRLIFMGTPEFAVPTLLALHGHEHEIVALAHPNTVAIEAEQGLVEKTSVAKSVSEMLSSAGAVSKQ